MISKIMTMNNGEILDKYKKPVAVFSDGRIIFPYSYNSFFLQYRLILTDLKVQINA